MNKPLKFSLKKQNIWVCGCTHFQHDREFIWGKRGFKSVQEHDEYIKTWWRKNIQWTDIVIHLGDAIFFSNANNFEETFTNLPGQIHMIRGNHNSGVSAFWRDQIKTQFNLENVEVSPVSYKNLIWHNESLTFSVDGQMAYAHHFPALVWDKNKDNCWHLHSHNHGTLKESLPDYKFGKRLECGVEVAMKFLNKPIFNWDDIHFIMKNKTIHIIDGYH